MKKKYSFTIEESLMDWFRVYVREESTTWRNIQPFALRKVVLNPKNLL